MQNGLIARQVFLQIHPDPERGHKALCTNCLTELTFGTFKTHKSDPKDTKPAAKRNPWLHQFGYPAILFVCSTDVSFSQVHCSTEMYHKPSVA
jgi:hypothetical protein